MLSLVKGALTPRAKGRPAESKAIRNARKALEAARERLGQVRDEQTARVEAARQAFEAEGTDDAADTLALAERRAELQTDRADAEVRKAAEALATLEIEAKEAHLAELDAVVESLSADIRELEPRTRSAIATLLDVARERDGLVTRADKAHREACSVRGIDPWPRTEGISGQRRALRAILRERLTIDEIEAIVALFTSDGPDFPAPPPRGAA